jgi:hypothetical protein
MTVIVSRKGFRENERKIQYCSNSLPKLMQFLHRSMQFLHWHQKLDFDRRRNYYGFKHFLVEHRTRVNRAKLKIAENRSI